MESLQTYSMSRNSRRFIFTFKWFQRIFIPKKKNIENLEETIVILRSDTSVIHWLTINLLDEIRKIEDVKIVISTEN